LAGLFANEKEEKGLVGGRSIYYECITERSLSKTATSFPLFGSDQFVDHGKLARPIDIVQKLAQIKAIVVGRVTFGVVGWCDGAHFVSVDGVVTKESLDLFSDHTWGEVTPDDAQFAVPVVFANQT